MNDILNQKRCLVCKDSHGMDRVAGNYCVVCEAVRQRQVCSWCGGRDVAMSREGCYGSFVHVICQKYGCGHEWDIVV